MFFNLKKNAKFMLKCKLFTFQLLLVQLVLLYPDCPVDLVTMTLPIQN